MDYISHPFIAPGRVESRSYQFTIAMRALDANTLVVIPTGLGKTAIALIVAASRLYRNGGKILMLAPTKPLVEQHVRYFRENILLPDSNEQSFALFTGEAPPAVRTAEWETASFVFATPQVIKNDIIAGRYDLADVSLLIVDEAHRAVGNYSYVFLAGRYRETAREPLLLAMTASPGSSSEKISDIVANLNITTVEARTEDDPDVSPYIHEKEVEIITVDLPPALKEALDDLTLLVESRLAALTQMGYLAPDKKSLSMKSLQELNVQIQQRIAEKDVAGFAAASIHAECMKLRHAIGLAETQGCMVLKQYLNKLLAEGSSSGGSKASRRIAEDPVFVRLLERSIGWNEECHPKLLMLPDLITEALSDNPDTRVIVFATYRDTVRMIVDILSEKGINAERFVGQAKRDTEKGLSQKKQIDAIRRFREGVFRVLVATSVGEEGLDIPSTDVVIFYEPVPSEIRSIQRKGRTGRHGTGRIILLVTKKTSDEAFRYVSQNREKSMTREMRRIGVREKREKQLALVLSSPEDRVIQKEFFDGPVITVDDRELNSKVVEHLSSGGAVIRLERMLYGDYATGRIVIERKTTRDFVDTLIERNLLEQIRLMAANSEKPVMIIEGESLYGERDLHPNAIRGALAAISINFSVPIFMTANAQETADLLMVLARREADGEHGERQAQKRSYGNVAATLEAIIGSYPDIGPKYARALLKEFGSVQGVVNADADALLKVVGIGEKKAKQVYDLSRQPYP